MGKKKTPDTRGYSSSSQPPKAVSTPGATTTSVASSDLPASDPFPSIKLPAALEVKLFEFLKSNQRSLVLKSSKVTRQRLAQYYSAIRSAGFSNDQTKAVLTLPLFIFSS
jgi:hypothetical protein